MQEQITTLYIYDTILSWMAMGIFLWSTHSWIVGIRNLERKEICRERTPKELFEDSRFFLALLKWRWQAVLQFFLGISLMIMFFIRQVFLV